MTPSCCDVKELALAGSAAHYNKEGMEVGVAGVCGRKILLASGDNEKWRKGNILFCEPFSPWFFD